MVTRNIATVRQLHFNPSLGVSDRGQAAAVRRGLSKTLTVL